MIANRGIMLGLAPRSHFGQSVIYSRSMARLSSKIVVWALYSLRRNGRILGIVAESLDR